jgi:hypothetical protein
MFQLKEYRKDGTEYNLALSQGWIQHDLAGGGALVPTAELCRVMCAASPSTTVFEL